MPLATYHGSSQLYFSGQIDSFHLLAVAGAASGGGACSRGFTGYLSLGATQVNPAIKQ